MSVNPPESDAGYRLWEMVSPTDYRVPSGPDQHLVRKKWAALRRLLRAQEDEVQSPVKAEADLRALPGVRLENLVPPIDWTAAAQALDLALAGENGPRGVCFVIGQPHCAHPEILAHWAKAQGVRLVSSPPYETILGADDGWLATLDEPDQPWVLPELERCFLRHAGGLSLVRQVFERATSGRLGRALIGCDGWAWAYLQRVFPAPQLPTLTLQAFDGRRLTELFIELSRAQGGRPLRFRNARTGAAVLPTPEALAEGKMEISRELRQLAAHCRGNPGVAWRYWRQRLRAEPESDPDTPPANPDQGSPSDGDKDTLWLSDTLDDPVPPAERSDDFVLILHALLLHNGLPSQLLPELLPLPAGQIASLLARLEALGMVEAQGDQRRVAALGYVRAREMLHERSFLVDPF
ncbi:MAG: hypothetical protein ACM3ST_14125 [Bdellovibrio bacteriovorus]